MANPTPYTPAYSFSGWQASNPTLPLPADKVDAEFNALNTALDETQTALQDVRRSDGKLVNKIVTIESLSSETLALFAGNPIAKGNWAAGTPYEVGSLVNNSGASYLCAVAHTSSPLFATDLAAGRWVLIAGTVVAPGSVTATELADNAVTNAKLADNAVNTAEIADGAVTTAKILDSAVGTPKIADAAVTNAKLANMAANTVKVNASATPGVPSDLALGASQLVGRGDTGNVTAVSLGAGLSITGGVLAVATSASAPDFLLTNAGVI